MRRLPPLLRRAWFSLNQAFRQRLIPLGITPDQFTILRWLVEGDEQGLTQSELTRRMASDPNTITATVRRMETAGLLARSAHETDGRAKRVKVTIHGLAVFSQAQSLALNLQNIALESLTKTESDTFLEMLERVGDACVKEASSKRLNRGADGALPSC